MSPISTVVDKIRNKARELRQRSLGGMSKINIEVMYCSGS